MGTNDGLWNCLKCDCEVAFLAVVVRMFCPLIQDLYHTMSNSLEAENECNLPGFIPSSLSLGSDRSSFAGGYRYFHDLYNWMQPSLDHPGKRGKNKQECYPCCDSSSLNLEQSMPCSVHETPFSRLGSGSNLKGICVRGMLDQVQVLQGLKLAQGGGLSFSSFSKILHLP